MDPDIKSMPDEEVINLYYEKAVSRFKKSWFNFSHNENWYKYITELPEKESTAYLVCLLDDQVYNGGFNQYFINGYGQFIKETILAFKRIKAFKMADLIEKAFLTVNFNNDDYKLFRKKIIAGKINELYNDNSNLNNYLEKLDDEYWEYPENIGNLLAECLRQ